MFVGSLSIFGGVGWAVCGLVGSGEFGTRAIIKSVCPFPFSFSFRLFLIHSWFPSLLCFLLPRCRTLFPQVFAEVSLQEAVDISTNVDFLATFVPARAPALHSDPTYHLSLTAMVSAIFSRFLGRL